MYEYADNKQAETDKKKVDASQRSPQIHSVALNVTDVHDTAKERFENLSGSTFGDVRMYYNSNKPAQLQARPYMHYKNAVLPMPAPTLSYSNVVQLMRIRLNNNPSENDEFEGLRAVDVSASQEAGVATDRPAPHILQQELTPKITPRTPPHTVAGPRVYVGETEDIVFEGHGRGWFFRTLEGFNAKRLAGIVGGLVEPDTIWKGRVVLLGCYTEPLVEKLSDELYKTFKKYRPTIIGTKADIKVPQGPGPKYARYAAPESYGERRKNLLLHSIATRVNQIFESQPTTTDASTVSSEDAAEFAGVDVKPGKTLKECYEQARSEIMSAAAIDFTDPEQVASKSGDYGYADFEMISGHEA